ncbi:hypothetical protein HDU76_012084 [Blyttiomyces sp. JEL0837]|nr:hypothetical protein HDU76_012084 [Blyttiomyces sp. JEL0837]
MRTISTTHTKRGYVTSHLQTSANVESVQPLLEHWKSTSNGYFLALEHFNTVLKPKVEALVSSTSPSSDSPVDLEPEFNAVLEALVTRRFRKMLANEKSMKDVEGVLEVMKMGGVQVDGVVGSVLVRAFAEEDSGCVEVLKDYRRTLVKVEEEKVALGENRKVESASDVNGKEPKKSRAAPLDYPENLIKELIDQIDKVQALKFNTKALDLFESLSSRGIMLNLASHNAILSCFANHGQPELALKHLIKMRDVGLEPDVHSYAHVIRAYGNAKDIEQARNWFDAFRSSELPTDSGPYVALIEAYINSGQVEDALYIMSNILAEDELNITPIYLITFMKSLLRAGKPDLVLDWFEHVKNDTSGAFPKVNPDMEDLAFAAAVDKGDFVKAKELFPGKEDRSGDAVALSSYAIMAAREGKEDALVGALLKLGSHRSTLGRPFSAVVEAFVDLRQKNFTLVTMADQLEVCKNAGFDDDPLDRAFIRILYANSNNFLRTYMTYVKGATLLEAGKSATVKIKLMNCFKERGRYVDNGKVTELTSGQFDHILNACFYERNGSYPKFEIGNNVKTVLEDMKKRKLKPTMCQFEMVLQHYRHYKDANGAAFWIKTMRDLGVVDGPRIPGEGITDIELKELSAKMMSLSDKGKLDEAVAIYYEKIQPADRYPARPAIIKFVGKCVAVGRDELAEKFETSVMETATRMQKADMGQLPISEGRFEGYVDSKRFKLARGHMPKVDAAEGQSHYRTYHVNRMINAMAADIRSKSATISANEAVELLSEPYKSVKHLASDPKNTISNIAHCNMLYLYANAEGHLEDALEVYNLLRSKKPSFLPGRPNMRVLVDGIANRGTMGMALTLADDLIELSSLNQHYKRASKEQTMMNQDFQIADSFMMPAYIGEAFIMMALNRFNDPRKADSILRMTDGVGCRYNENVYLHVMHSHIRERDGRPGAVVDLVNLMRRRKQSVRSNVVEDIVVAMCAESLTRKEVLGDAVNVLEWVMDRSEDARRQQAQNPADDGSSHFVMSPTLRTAEAVIVASIQVGEAEYLERGLQAAAKLDGNLSTNISNQLLAFYLRSDRLQDAVALFQKMNPHVDAETQPATQGSRDLNSFIILISGVLQNQRADLAKALVDLMNAEGFTETELEGARAKIAEVTSELIKA